MELMNGSLYNSQCWRVGTLNPSHFIFIALFIYSIFYFPIFPPQ